MLRLAVEPDDRNGLLAPSSLMVDKITTMPRRKLDAKIGQLADSDMVRLGRFRRSVVS